MKAVVLEIKHKWAAVLCEDGVVRKIKKEHLSVGDTVEFDFVKSNKVISLRPFRRYLATGAAAAIILAAGAGGLHSYNTAWACSYVSLDINPSLEYTLNRKNRIIGVEGLNEEGREIARGLKENNIKNTTLEDALIQTKDLLVQNNYIGETAAEYVLIDVSTNDDVRRDSLQKEAASVFSEESTGKGLELVLTGSTISEHKAAKSFGISTGTYRQIWNIQKDKRENLENSGSGILNQGDIEKYKNYTVGELLESSGEIKKETSVDNSTETTSVFDNKSSSEESKSSLQESSEYQTEITTEMPKEEPGSPETSVNDRTTKTQNNDTTKVSPDRDNSQTESNTPVSSQQIEENYTQEQNNAETPSLKDPVSGESSIGKDPETSKNPGASENFGAKDGGEFGGEKNRGHSR